MNDIKITIVIPCLNTEKFIEECLNSVVNQSLKEIEIICVDGGSTDKTIEIINKFRLSDSRIKLLNSDKKSYGYQVNLGFNNSNGEYLAIVEPDDYLELDMYEKLYKHATKLHVDFVKSNFIKFTSNGKGCSSTLIKLTSDESLYNKKISPRKKMIIFNFEIPNWTGIFKKSFIDDNKIRHNETPGASFQDTGFWFSTFASAKKCAFINEAFYHYRIDNPSSSINNNKKIFCVCDEYRFIKDYLKNHNLFNKFSSVYYYFMFVHYRGTTYRLNDGDKASFMRKFKNDFLEAYHGKTLNLSKFNVSEINELYNILGIKPLTKLQQIHKFMLNALWVARRYGLKHSIKLVLTKIKNRFFCHK